MLLYPSRSQNIEDTIQMKFTHTNIDTIVGLSNRFRRHVVSGKESRGSPGPHSKAAKLGNQHPNYFIVLSIVQNFVGNIGLQVWDDGLANAAWQWVQHCQFYHDSSLHGIIMFLLSLVFIATHQNIAITMSSERSTTPNWADAAIHPWYAEVEHMDCRHVTRFR